MPVQERTSQRNFTRPLGTTFTQGFNPPLTKRTFNNTFEQGRTFVAAEAIAKAHQPVFVDIGTPRLRTVWNVQQVQFQFKLGCVRFVGAETALPLKVTFAFELLSGNTVVAITLLRFKLPEAKKTKEETQEFYFSIEELKLYTLELFSEVSVYGGEQLALRVKLEEGYTSPNVAEHFELFFEEAVLNVVFAQLVKAKGRT